MSAATAPKLSKSDQQLVDRATELGLDVDPANFDTEALKPAIEIMELAAKGEEHVAREKYGDNLVTDTLGSAEDWGPSTDPPSLVEVLKAAKVGQRGLDAIADSMPGSPSERSDEMAKAGATDEQQQRARDAGKAKAGLRGAALARWIVFGETGKQQTEQARAQRGATTKPAATSGPREGTTMWAALKVLRASRKPLKGSEVYEKIAAQKLAPGLKGKTPEATVTAALNVAAKKGEHGIYRPEPGRFAVKKDA